MKKIIKGSYAKLNTKLILSVTNLVVHNTLYLTEKNFMVTVTGLINSFTFIVDGLTDSFILI